MTTAFWVLLAFVVGVVLGYQFAHNVVAAECDRLGGFFVGPKVYKCVKTEVSVPPVLNGHQPLPHAGPVAPPPRNP